ncbi:hypothetical protein ACFE04_028756 [Oxalis oulophora]
MFDFIIFFFFTIFISLLLLYLLFFIINASSSSSKNPTPESYPLIGNLIGFFINFHRFHDWVTDMLSSTPSSTLQVNYFLNLSHGVCTSNPINIQHILASNFTNYVKGSRYQNVLHELLGTGMFAIDGQLWSLQRKIASNEFNTRSLQRFISQVVKSEIRDSLMPFLSNACDENRVVDLQEVLEKFAFKNISRVVFGFVSESDEFVRAFNDAVESCLARLMSPLPAFWKIKRYFGVGSERRLKEALEVINRYAMEIIKSKESKSENEDKSQDLLSRFMSTAEDMEFENEEQKRMFLRDIIISFVLAGKDTTSTALTWFFWLMAGNSHCHCTQSIITELSSSLPPPDDTDQNSPRIFSYDELKKFHYLHAALSESMRLFPPVAINSRLALESDTLPDGTYVGKNWHADYSAYAVGRMVNVWGSDCREFKPERWLESGTGLFKPVDQFKYPVFHGGPRLCLGKEMAYVQMKCIVAAVMYEFEVEPVSGGCNEENMRNPPYVLSMVMKMRGGLPTIMSFQVIRNLNDQS